MKLTADTVTALTLPDGKADYIQWDPDLPGFGVRLRGGSKRWVIQYRIGDRQRREALGDVRKVRLDDARRIARQRFAQVELGTDPAAERGKARAAAAASRLTLANVAERYLDAKADVLRPSTYNQAKMHLAAHWGPFADRPIESIRRADVAARLQELVKANGRTAAARARGNLSALYGWAMREGLCEANPVIATNDPDAGILPRDRVLTDHELATVWKACWDDDFGRIIKLLVLTGARREEVGSLVWSEIDLDTGTMSVSGKRTKNHRPLVLTLPAVAVDILRSVPRREGREYVFGSRAGTFSGWGYAKMGLDTRITVAEGKPLPHWTIHDLRRTARTGLGKIGIPPHVAELVINHVRGGVEAIYDRHRYEREIKQALAQWADYVLAVVEGRENKVVALRA
jgi:integrase